MKQMALILPYRNRAEHLQQFLSYFPEKNPPTPQYSYKIIVVEQADEKLFNRGKLLNIGFLLTQAEADYFCFHDVDMLPLDVDYSCPLCPTHLAADVSQFRERKEGHEGLPYANYFGGVALFPKEDFMRCNGYSNGYWGYGAEDDDLLIRMFRCGLKWERRNGVFLSLAHPFHGGSEAHKTNLLRYKAIAMEEEQDPSGIRDADYILVSDELKNGVRYVKVLL